MGIRKLIWEIKTALIHVKSNLFSIKHDNFIRIKKFLNKIQVWYVSQLKKMKFLKIFGGILRIKDCIFEYENPLKRIEIQGDLNPDLKCDYYDLDANVFSITIGRSLVYNSTVDREYVHYRLIETIF